MDIIDTDKAAKIRKTIHLIRHGQTDFNLENIIQGSGIDSRLNAMGRQQAERFYETFKDMAYSHIYTSQLMRTIESVSRFIDSGIPHSRLGEFNEINWGIMEGQKSTPDNFKIYSDIVAKWSRGLLDITVEGGETPNEMYARQARGLELLMSKKEEEVILICMHGRALRSFLCLLTDTPLREMEKWQHSNLCLYELEFNGRYFDIVHENDINHLKG